MANIDGLSTGLDTTAIIDALLAVERLPQDRIVARRAKSQAAATVLGSLKTSVANLRNSAADLRLSSGWEKLVGSSSSETVAVEASSGGFTGSISFRVDALATSHVVYSNDVFETLESPAGATTLGELVGSINADAELDFVAVAIQTGEGFRLQLAAKEGGEGSTVDLTTPSLAGIGFTTLTEGADAQITFEGLNPYSITSKSNSFTDLIPGVVVSVSEVSTTPVTVAVGHDYEQIADSVEALVAQFNELKTTMAASTRVDPGLANQVPLAFNSNVRRSEQALVSAFVNPINGADLSAPSQAGITLQRDGTLAFDRDKFIEAATADNASVSRLFIAPGADDDPGILDRLVEAGDLATTFGTGLLATAEEYEKSRIEDFSAQIEAFEDRLIRKEEQLRKLYSNLEVAIGSLNNQSNWLAGQLSSLAGSGGDS
ncbi:MAG: flagellar hook-associated protein 2 [Acidimicrobiales bacterium]|jgi:flagellar hook-associated protein 2